MALTVQRKGQPRLLDVNRTPGQPKKRKKITLVFDDKKRREFLGGFHKRKVQRQKKAQEELKKQLKEERKRIKTDAKERFKKLVSSRDVPELQQLLTEREYETEGHTVSILELNVSDLTESGALIGENRPTESPEPSEDESEVLGTVDGLHDEDVEGMSLVEPEEEQRGKRAKRKEDSEVKKEPSTKKEVKKAVKRAALKEVKKSKAFQQKQKLERVKNKKESRRKLKRLQKAQKKSGKPKKKAKH